MAAAPVPGRTPAKDQKPFPEAVFLKNLRSKKYGTWHYSPLFDELVFQLLSESDQAKCKTHVANALLCSRDTLDRWLQNYPSFKEAFDAGMAIGEEKWRDKIANHAWEPTKEVNNGLIKLLSSNVYGIKEEVEPVVVQNNIITDPEKLMKDRGIPMPDLGVDDLDFETEQEPESKGED